MAMRLNFFRGPASKTDISLVDKIELARAYQNITSNSLLDIPINLDLLIL